MDYPVPIDIDEFEAASEKELQGRDQSLREAVIEYLAYNPSMAYSRKELQSSLEVDAINLLHQLSALEREGVVRHKGQFWAIAEDYEEDGQSQL